MAETEVSQWGRLKRNLGFKDVWEELSGSVGDLGTFLPIVLALVLVNGIDLGTTLLFTGAYNVITGAWKLHDMFCVFVSKFLLGLLSCRLGSGGCNLEKFRS